jgi:hypothetical protein
VKVLLVVIDGAAPRVVGPAIQTGRLPVLQRLVEAGAYSDTCTTIFPSITPAATTTIITGEYPASSGILGASWYDETSQDVAYYGDDFWVIAKAGFREFLDDFLMRLNGDRLVAPTLFEVVERSGMRAACLNYLIFKGLYENEVHVPTAFRLLPGVRRKELVHTPSIVAIGDFLTTRTMRGKPLDDVSGALHRFGMDDASTSQMLLEIAEEKVFPDFTVAYFADNDFRSHEVGAAQALSTVERVDQGLGAAFEMYGGIDRVLRDMYVIVISDHGHVDVLADRERSVICLDKALAAFKQATLGKVWEPGDEIMVCPNMRSTQVYFRHPTASALRKAIAATLATPGVDHAIYRGADVEGVRDHFFVASTRGALEFWRGATGDRHARDAFGSTWSWSGDLAVVDAQVADGEFAFDAYPNAFERLAGILEHEHSATLWVTAKPGCEFEVPGSAAHVGGSSHGGLHALESYCPLIVAGPERVTLPRHVRTVDVAPLCLNLLGIPSRHRVGEPRQRMTSDATHA